MASVLPVPEASALHPSTPAGTNTWLLTACSALALLLLGYHPNAEDGGIYAAAAAARLQPSLFPAEHGFAIAQSGRSLFVPLLVDVTRMVHLSLSAVLLLSFVACVVATLVTAQMLVRELFVDRRDHPGAVLLFAAALGLPIAGTSLYLADPYLTARSLSTPLLLLGLVWMMRGRVQATLLCLVAAAAVHPIMALCALPMFACYAAARLRARNGLLVCLVLIALCMAALQWLGPAELPAQRAAALTRLYWFPRSWAAYEWLGALAPPLLLLGVRHRLSGRLTGQARDLLLSAALAALLVFTCTCCLAHTDSRSLLLARLQPLRLLHLLYCIFLPVIGGVLAGSVPSHRLRLPVLGSVAAAVCLLLMQRTLYRDSGHFEVTDSSPRNGYVQAFQWVRANTPTDALFALDAQYTRAAGEDAQLFRAVALRSALPDAAKDGGIAAMLPALAPEWLRASDAQQGLNMLPDRDRLKRLRPFHATWLLLPAERRTAFPCPYRNTTVQVCRLP